MKKKMIKKLLCLIGKHKSISVYLDGYCEWYCIRCLKLLARRED